MDCSVVIVHGLFGGSKDNTATRTNPGSGTSKWVDDYTESLKSDSRRLVYRYDATKIVARSRIRTAVKEQAIRLLENLVDLRKNESTVCVLIL